MPSPAERPRGLLHRDEEELDRAALALRAPRPAVAFVACEEALREAARAHLAAGLGGGAIPAPERVGGSEAMFAILKEIATQPADVVRSAAIPARDDEVLRTLNWHREKLREGARVILWVEGVKELARLREAAPDAYSFRDVVAVVRGEPPLPAVAPEEEPADLRLARARLARAMTPRERAAARAALSEQMSWFGMHAEAERAALDGLRDLEAADDGVGADLETKAVLYDELSWQSYARRAHARRNRWIDLGLAAVAAGGRGAKRWERSFLVDRWTAAGPDDSACRGALGDALAEREDPHRIAHILGNLVDGALARGDLKAGLRWAEERAALSRSLPHVAAALSAADLADVALAAGDAIEAERRFQGAADRFLAADADAAVPILCIGRCLAARSELDAAGRVLERLASRVHDGHIVRADIERERGLLWIAAGDLPRSLARIRDAIHISAALGSDGNHFAACSALVSALAEARAADRLSAADLTAAEADLDVAEDVSRAMVGDDPPWYTVLFPGLRSELLALRPDRLPAAVDLAAAALARARQCCPELIPKEGRILATHLLSACRPGELLAILPELEAAARQQEHLRELARLQRIAVTLARASHPDDASAALAALRETLEATGSPRIRAETLLDLARDLPPESRSPDPLALLEEALALFLEMPMPSREARCLEVAGDVHAARGELVEARRRYLAARRRAERYGLGLRLPLLSSKLDRLG